MGSRSASPSFCRSSVTSAIPASNRLVRRADPALRARRPDLARIDRVESEHRPAQFGPARADQSRQADDLAGAQREG